MPGAGVGVFLVTPILYRPVGLVSIDSCSFPRCLCNSGHPWCAEVPRLQISTKFFWEGNRRVAESRQYIALIVGSMAWNRGE